MAYCLNCQTYTEIGVGSQRQLVALDLRDKRGMSFKEIGTELGVTRQRAMKLVELGRRVDPNRAPTRTRHEWQVKNRTAREGAVVVEYGCSCGNGHGELTHSRG